MPFATEEVYDSPVTPGDASNINKHHTIERTFP